MSERDLMDWTLVGYAAVAGAALLALLGLFVGARSSQRRWLPIERLRPGTWTGYEVFLVFCVIQGFPQLIVEILLLLGFFSVLIGPEPDLDVDNGSLNEYLLRCTSISTPLSFVLILAVIMAILYARTNTRPHHYGLTWARWRANLALGLVAFIGATPIILGVQVLATRLLWSRSHGLTQLGKLDLYRWEWIFLAMQPIVAAPILEEIAFRGILQGWLRRASLAGHFGVLAVSLSLSAMKTSYVDTKENLLVFDAGPFVFAMLLTGVYGWQLFRLARQFHLDETAIRPWQAHREIGTGMSPDESKIKRWEQANARMAIFGTAILFAVVHSNAWPAPIALFLMALVLGWLSSRTQSLIGPITFHALFNLVSFIALFGTTHSK